ncbi:hypothetical protein MPSEU_000222200 [Mayamaea pseudoterrestris]|nr:hypothetical protein MPSEU_000222200 [Mayamaea pseudoterrestris]
MDVLVTSEGQTKLFALSEHDYQRQAPDWLRRVQQPASDTNESAQKLLTQLQTVSKTNRRLEQVLVNSNVPLPTDIPYAEAKLKIADINAMLSTCINQNEYQALAVELDKYTAALMASDEYQAELVEQEREWERANRSDNERALHAVRRHMPVQVRFCSEASLSDEHGLPKPLARKLVRTNVLQLLRKRPSDIEKMHPSMLEGFKTTGLTLTERRALYLHMLPLAGSWSKAKDQMTERKMTWYNMMKQKFQEGLGQWQHHVKEYGLPCATHKCNLIGNQCPFKADTGAMDYYSSGGYGFPEGDVYEQSEQAATVKLFPTTMSPSPLSPGNRSRSFLGPASLSPSAVARSRSFLGELTKATSQCAPAVSSSGEANRPLLSEVVNKAPKLAARRQESISRKPPEPTRSRKNLLNELEGKKPALPAPAAAGGLLAGIANMKLKKTEGPKEKASLIKEVAPGTKPTVKVAASSPPPTLAPAAERKPSTRKERQTSVTSVVVLDEAGERVLALKQHYQRIGKTSQIEEARVSCESLDAAMDKLESDLEQYIYWQLLDTDDMLSDSEKSRQIEAFRTTLQTTETTVSELNKRVYSSIGDDRSLIEVELAEDLHKMISSAVVFILTRGKELKKKDKGIRDHVVSINSKMQGIHSNNELALKKLGEGATPTRKVRTVAHITEKKKNLLSLQERSAIRAAGLERHYGKGKTAAAAILCDNLDAAMDRLDSYMDGWVDQMMQTDDTKTSDTEKQKLLGYYMTALEGLKIPVKELVQRTTSQSCSKTECEMIEDLHRLSSCVFNFIMQRMKKLDVKDKTIKKLLRELNEDIKSVHEEAVKSLKAFNLDAQPTRKVRSVKQIIEAKVNEKEKKTKQVVKKIVKTVKHEVVEVPVTPTGTPTRKASSTSPNRATTIPPPPVPPSPKTPEKSLIVSDVVGRDQLKWQLMKQVKDAVTMKRKLEKAITSNGLTIPDEKIGFEEAERKMTEISKRMQEVGHKHPEYFTLEQQMEKYQSALLASDEYQKTMKRREQDWEDCVAPENQKALVKLRRHMPVNIRNVSEAELSSTPTPNGKLLPATIVKKLKRTNVLQLIRLSPEYIENVHFANLEGMSLSGLTLTENRALYEHVRVLGPKWERGRKDKSIERKFMWYQLVRNKLRQAIDQQSSTKEVISYEGDYGFPTGAVYEVLEVAKEDMDKYRNNM